MPYDAPVIPSSIIPPVDLFDGGGGGNGMDLWFSPKSGARGASSGNVKTLKRQNARGPMNKKLKQRQKPRACPACRGDASICAARAECEWLYVIAKNVTHSLGLAWTDPRTGILYAPKKKHDA